MVLKVAPAIHEPFVNNEGKITDLWYKYLLSIANSSSDSSSGTDSNEIPTMGKIFQSILPIEDDNVHLLDGELLSYSDEKYQSFIDYVVSLLTDYPDLFCSEEDYQTSITTYGVCGKFVYDSDANTLRLPTITGFTEGSITLTEIGDLTEAGLPNITGSAEVYWESQTTPVGAFYADTTRYNSERNNNSGYPNLGFDASLVSDVYGNSDTVQPQSVKVLFYIVINNLTNSTIKKYLDDNASRTINHYVDTVSKPDIDAEVENGKLEIQNAVNAAIAQLLAADRNIPFMKYEWDDKLRNDVSWLRADTFSWQDGTVYEGVYNHLVDDIDGKTLQSETVAGITIQYYEADDTHKICPASEADNVLSLYNSIGVAWYYILDTVNQRFKLPRINPAVEKLIILMRAKGNGKSLGLIGKNGSTIIENSLAHINNYWLAPGSLASADVGASATAGSIPVNTYAGVNTDPTKSGIVIDPIDADTAFAGKRYLYFYVGEYTHTAIENTAGLNADLFNSKVDTDASNLNTVGKAKIVNLTSPDSSNIIPLTVPASGTAIEMPDDGILSWGCRFNSRDDHISLELIDSNNNIIRKLQCNAGYSNNHGAWNGGLEMQVSKGDIITFYHYGETYNTGLGLRLIKYKGN